MKLYHDVDLLHVIQFISYEHNINVIITFLLRLTRAEVATRRVRQNIKKILLLLSIRIYYNFIRFKSVRKKSLLFKSSDHFIFLKSLKSLSNF